ncbi:MAG TPA: STAS domain-containing protein [Gammaproteobacteria bacterium]|nr:STAS domain-containing protein [Gammaproteobacteria bacterium]
MTDSAATLKPTGAGDYQLSGCLDFISVPRLLRQGHDWLGNGSRVQLDLSGVTRCNSAALGLLLEWRRQAAARKTGLLLRNIPPPLLEIARVSELESFLGD